MKMNYGLFVLACAALLASGCNDRGDEAVAAPTLAAEAPNSFLTYINTQASLPAGDYEIVAATNIAGGSGDYLLEITRDDGTTQQLPGQWVSSGGESASAAGNPRHAITLDHAGGLKVALTSTVDGYLYLVRGGQVLAEDDNSGANGNPLIDLALSRISSVAYADAYYAAVDPNAERTTIEDFKRKNCFVAGNPACAAETIGHDAHVVFRDSKDLGYGRNMYARRNSDGSVAFFVENYVIALQPGSASNYGPVNVDAAVNQNREYFRGTNAIEFSPLDPANPASAKITRFFTYNPAGTRITSADLDGRGVKHMPGMCWVCHGGRTLPLDENGDFPLLALRSAKFNQLELDTFDYSALAGYTQAAQETAFRTINGFVHDSYTDMSARDDAEAGKWYAGFALDIAEGRYGGAGLPALTYQTDYVPAGWQQTVDRPQGVAQLYKRVIEPHCVGCHALQGGNAAENVPGLANAINFSSWERFISNRERIIDYVFQRGAMPLSLRNFEDFWRDPQDKPALLAAFLSEPTLFDASGHVLEPGLPVAHPGTDRTVRSPVALDGAASPFAQAYLWEIVAAPLGADVSLSDSRSAVPVLTTDTDGDYVLSLTVVNALGASAPATVTVTIDSGATDQAQLTFVNDVLPLLENGVSGIACTSCHSATGSGNYPGIPVSYRTADNPNVYRDVVMRVNFADPQNSLLVRKPTGLQHGGGVQIDRATVEGRAGYNTLLNWIRAGAPCGTGVVCANQ